MWKLLIYLVVGGVVAWAGSHPWSSSSCSNFKNFATSVGLCQRSCTFRCVGFDGQ